MELGIFVQGQVRASGRPIDPAPAVDPDLRTGPGYRTTRRPTRGAVRAER